LGGTDSQKTGHVGQILVQAELAPRGFVSGLLDPDLGEDLWIEVEGFKAAAAGSFPLRALLQVKSSHSTEEPSFPYDLSIKHIRRWMAQPQPVFVVGITTEAPRRFYAKSIDSIITDDLKGQDVAQLTSKSVRVHLPPVDDLSAFLKAELEAFYLSSQLILKGLPENVIDQEYFEVCKRSAPQAWETPPVATWSVLWKSPRRPQYLSAVLTELARRAEAEYSGSVPRPAIVVFHVYRSLSDLQRNLAVARVDWVDPTHPKAADIIGILGAPGGFRMRLDKDVDETREFIRSRTARPDDFLAYAERVGTAFDWVCDKLIDDPSPEAWNGPLKDMFREAETLWDTGPFAPTEHSELEKVLTAQHAALFDHHYVALYRRDKLPPATVSRLLEESRARMRTCRGAWRLFLPRP
jgi:hypothetical protein